VGFAFCTQPDGSLVIGKKICYTRASTCFARQWHKICKTHAYADAKTIIYNQNTSRFRLVSAWRLHNGQNHRAGAFGNGATSFEYGDGSRIAIRKFYGFCKPKNFLGYKLF
jgi:hypothetical protein